MRILIFTTLVTLTFLNKTISQSTSTPLEYIEHFSKEFVHIQSLQIEYSSFLVYTRSDIAEDKRQELLKATKKIHDRFENFEAMEDDKGVKASAVGVLESMLDIGNKNYSTLAAEEVGCHDCFASVLKEYEFSDKDSEKMGKDMDQLIKNIDVFAAANNIEMIEDATNHETMLGKINRLNRYLRELDLANMEVQYADNEITKAMNNKDYSKAKEMVKNLSKAAANAAKRLKKVERIKEDVTAYTQSQKLVDFFKTAAKTIYPDMLSAYDKKGNVINEKVDLYNESIQKLNSKIPTLTNKYENAKLNLQQRHIPKPQTDVKRI